MMSNNAKQILVKGLIISTVATAALPLAMPQTAYAASNVANVEGAESKGLLETFSEIGSSIFAGGEEFFDALRDYGDMQQYTMPFLSEKAAPNSEAELVNPYTGKLLQRRIYDENGDAKMDIDYTVHGNAAMQDSPHKHIWEGGKRNAAEDLTSFETLKYLCIPRGYVSSTTKPNHEKTMDGEQAGVQISYDELKSILIRNHDVKFRYEGTVYTISYGKNAEGITGYSLSYFRNFCGAQILEVTSYTSKRPLLEKHLFRGNTLEDICDEITVLNIF
ncbi:MAG: hypothetical protein RR922_03515 [Clostridia bacterium]